MCIRRETLWFCPQIPFWELWAAALPVCLELACSPYLRSAGPILFPKPGPTLGIGACRTFFGQVEVIGHCWSVMVHMCVMYWVGKRLAK